MWKKVKASNLFVCLLFFCVGFWFFVFLGSLFFLEKERLVFCFFFGAGGWRGAGFWFSEGGGDGVSYGMESP